LILVNKIYPHIIYQVEKKYTTTFKYGWGTNKSMGTNGPLPKIHWAQHEDYIFVLQLDSFGPKNNQSSSNELHMYYIEDFWNEMEWVNVETYNCNHFEYLSKILWYSMYLHACDWFLLVIIELPLLDFKDWFYIYLAFPLLNDLSTSKWSTSQLLKLLHDKKSIIWGISSW